MKSPRRVTFLFTGILVVTGILTVGLRPRTAPAKEPVQELLDRLRERGYFNTAREYLDSLRDDPNIAAEIKETVAYEQGRILVEESRIQPLAERLKLLDQARQRFEEFVNKSASHDLAGMARIQMGNVLVERGRAFVDQADRTSDGKEKETTRSQARGEFKKAQSAFEAAVKDFEAKLAKYPKFLDKKEQKLREARSKARRDLIEAKFYLANTFFQVGKTYGTGTKEHKATFTESAARFKKIYDDYRTWLAGLYAKLWEGRSYHEMDGAEDIRRAISAYMELLDQPDEGQLVFRELKAKALRYAIDAWSHKTQEKFDSAVPRGQDWLRQARSGEESTPEGLAIQFLVAKAMHLWNQSDRAILKGAKEKPKSKGPKKKDPKDNGPKVKLPDETDITRREAQIVAYCRRVMASPGEFRKEAQDLLALYRNVQEQAPKTFEEAFDRGSTTLGVWEAVNKSLKEATDPKEKKKLEQDAQIAMNDMVKWFRLAVSMKDDPSATPDKVNDARHALSFVYFRQGRKWDSAILGEWLARHYPKYRNSQQAAWFAFAAWLDVYNDTPASQGAKPFETEQLVRVANLITQQWPKSDRAIDAWMILGDLASREKKLTQAKAYYVRIPANSPRRPDADLKLGQALWSMYLSQSREQPKPPGTDALLTEAIKRLQQGVLAKRKAKDVNLSLLGGELALAQIFVNRGTDKDAKQAVALLTGEGAFLPLYKAGDKNAQDPNVVREAHKALLRAYVTTGETDKALEMKKALEAIMTGPAAKGGGQAALTQLYVSLGRDISQQLAGADAKDRERLVGAFDIFLRELLNAQSVDFGTTHWVAETYVGLADGLANAPATKAKAKTYYTQAVSAYTKMQQTKASERQALAGKTPQDEKRLQELDGLLDAIATRLGKSQRGAGQYGAAAQTFINLLWKRPNLLEAQREACLTFKEWAKSGETKRYDDSRRGIKHKGKEIIWGWALMSKRLQRYVKDPEKKALRDYFFEARYELSLSYHDHAMVPGADREKLLERGYESIDILYRLYKNDMTNDPELRKKFDALLVKIQTGLGKPRQGLRGLEQASTSK